MKKKILLLVLSLSLMSAGASAAGRPSKIWSGFKTVVGCPLATVTEVPLVGVGAAGAVVIGVAEITSRVFNSDIDSNMTTAEEIKSSKEMLITVFTQGCLLNVRELTAKTDESQATKNVTGEQMASAPAARSEPAGARALAD